VAVSGWLLDKSVAARLGADPVIADQVAGIDASISLCQVGLLEQLVSARSARDYDRMHAELTAAFSVVAAPPDALDRALRLQRDLAHHHGLWHRTPMPDLLIAETALHHGLGVLHIDRDFKRIAGVRPLRQQRLRTSR